MTKYYKMLDSFVQSINVNWFIRVDGEPTRIYRVFNENNYCMVSGTYREVINYLNGYMDCLNITVTGIAYK